MEERFGYISGASTDAPIEPAGCQSHCLARKAAVGNYGIERQGVWPMWLQLVVIKLVLGGEFNGAPKFVRGADP